MISSSLPVAVRSCFKSVAALPLIVAVLMTGAASLQAGLEDSSYVTPYNDPPINYEASKPNDPVAQLGALIQSGKVKITFDQKHGYLPSLLKALKIDPSSQVMVFSKTSLQIRKISPAKPRAIYFNDDVYLGWVQEGEVMEVSSVDPELGGVFYTMKQEAAARPQFVRDKQCLSCHATSRTVGVPGHLVRSIYADPSGQPLESTNALVTNHRTPFAERWGGWYVTGSHGSLRHLGNVTSRDALNAERLDKELGANVTDLGKFFDIEPYFRKTSDLIALMVIEHQSYMHNLMTRVNYEAKMALRDQAVLDQMSGGPPASKTGNYSDSTQRRIAIAGDALLKYMLFVDEEILDEPIAGVSGFTDYFQSLGPKDHKGRSLRDLSLDKTLFKYPCSYLIYSRSFDALPAELKNYVLKRLHNILTGADATRDFSSLSRRSRQAVLEILLDTKLNLPEYWRKGTPAVGQASGQ